MEVELLKASFIFTAAAAIFLINSDLIPKLSQSIKKAIISQKRHEVK